MTIGPGARQYLSEQIESLRAAEQLRLDEVEELPGGWETDIYRIAVTYLKDDARIHEDLVIRLYAGPHASERAKREFQILRGAGRAGLPVPRPELLFESSAGLGSPSVVMEYVHGPTLARVLEDNPEAVEEWLEEMVRLLIRVHQVKPIDALVALPPVPGVVAPDMEAMYEALEQFGLEGFEAGLLWLEQNSGSAEVTRSFLHSDFHPGNIIVRDGSLVVVDWSFAEIGDHRLDLAWSALILTDLLGSSYRSWLISNYARLSDRPLEDFAYFEGLKLGARLMTLAAWLEGSMEIPVKKITPGAMRGRYQGYVLNVYERWKAVTAVRIPVFENL